MDVEHEKETVKETVYKSGPAGRLLVTIILLALLAIVIIGLIRLFT